MTADYTVSPSSFAARLTLGVVRDDLQAGGTLSVTEHRELALAPLWLRGLTTEPYWQDGRLHYRVKGVT